MSGLICKNGSLGYLGGKLSTSGPGGDTDCCCGASDKLPSLSPCGTPDTLMLGLRPEDDPAYPGSTPPGTVLLYGGRCFVLGTLTSGRTPTTMAATTGPTDCADTECQPTGPCPEGSPSNPSGSQVTQIVVTISGVPTAICCGGTGVGAAQSPNGTWTFIYDSAGPGTGFTQINLAADPTTGAYFEISVSAGCTGNASCSIYLYCLNPQGTTTYITPNGVPAAGCQCAFFSGTGTMLDGGNPGLFICGNVPITCTITTY